MRTRLVPIVVLSAMIAVLSVACATTPSTQVQTGAVTPTAATAIGSAPAAAPSASALQPLSSQTCAELAAAMSTTLGVAVTQSQAPITDPATGQSGTSCQATATGTGEQFAAPDKVVHEIAGMLQSQGWQEDPKLAAGGATGFGEGFRKENAMCMAVAQWQPDASANCPKDKPITTCQVTPKQKLYTVTLNCAQSSAGQGSAGMANPASVNCTKQGGTLSMETRGDEGQYGVCYFEDNRQCEEWALLRGDCPVGGVKVTGYVTPAGRYCAITGGAYKATGTSSAGTEQGTCTFKNGKTCDAWDYYNGKCSTAAQ
jgi:putative hemolysin